MSQSFKSLLKTGQASALALGVALALQAPAHAEDLVPPPVMTLTPGGVDLGTGAITRTETDLSIGALTLQRIWMPFLAPMDPNTPLFGYHMTNNFDIFVAPNFVPQSGVGVYQIPQHYEPVVHLGGGSSGQFYQYYTGGIVPDTGDSTKGFLTIVGNNYVYTDQSGTVYTFTSTVSPGGRDWQGQRVQNIVYSNGRRLDFTYNSAARLKIVTDNSGYALVFDYDSNGAATAACGFNLTQTTVSVSTTCTGATLKTTYTYNSNASMSVMTGAVDVFGHGSFYGNPGDGSYCIRPAGYSACKVAFFGSTQDNQPTQEVLGDGSTRTFSYDKTCYPMDDLTCYPTDGNHLTDVTDPNGKVWHYVFTESSPYRFTDPLGNVTSYTYFGGASSHNPLHTFPMEATNYGGMLQKAVLPEGGQYIETHGGLWTQVTERRWKSKTPGTPADVVETYTYNTCSNAGPPSLYCTQPITYTDPKGNVTEFTYSSVHGGMLTKTLPFDSSPTPKRRRTYNTYTAFNTGNGTIYRVTRSETCGLTAAQLSLTACPTGAGTESTTSVTTTDYGTSSTAPYTYRGFQPLTVTQTDGNNSLTATTTYSYDVYGNVISVDGPLSGTVDQTFKTYDLARRVVCEIGVDPDGGGSLVRAMVRHNYDDAGREWKTETGTGTSTTSCLGANMNVVRFTRLTFDGFDHVIKTEVVQP